MKKLFLTALGAVLAVSAQAQTVTKLAATKANDYGIAYSLPRTVIDIDLEAECTVRTPGEFYNYAERYLGTEAARKAVGKPSTSWRLTKAVLTPRGEIADGAEQWLMQFKAGAPVFVALDAQGVPVAISAEPDAAEAAAPAAPASADMSKSPLETAAARYAVTEEMVQGSSLAKRAQLAADQIMQLRQSRQDYLTGQADVMPDGKALELILNNINAQEEALTAMFLGTVQTRTASTRAVYVPADGDAADVVIARINALSGFVGADDLSGAPVYLQMKVADRGRLPKTEKGEPKAFPKNGVPYCIPGAAEFAVEFDGRKVAGARFNVAQLGVVFGLNPALFSSKKEPGYAIFDPVTGGLKELGTLNETAD